MNKPTFETTQCTFESDKWKGDIKILYNQAVFSSDPKISIELSNLIDYISGLLAEQKKEILSQTEQECDKKWKLKVKEHKERYIASFKSTRHIQQAVAYTEKIEALDDLLKQ